MKQCSKKGKSCTVPRTVQCAPKALPKLDVVFEGQELEDDVEHRHHLEEEEEEEEEEDAQE